MARHRCADSLRVVHAATAGWDMRHTDKREAAGRLVEHRLQVADVDVAVCCLTNNVYRHIKPLCDLQEAHSVAHIITTQS